MRKYFKIISRVEQFLSKYAYPCFQILAQNLERFNKKKVINWFWNSEEHITYYCE